MLKTGVKKHALKNTTTLLNNEKIIIYDFEGLLGKEFDSQSSSKS